MVAQQSYDGPALSTRDKIVVIPPGGVATVAQTLAHNGVIAHPLVFRAATWWTRHNGPLKAGEYLFPAHASLRHILEILRAGIEVQHQATIPEGLTSAQIAALINQLPEATGGQITPPPEGSVLPQTYDYVRGAKRGMIVARMQAAMRHTVQTLWAQRNENMLQSPQEAVVLASIVQQETPLASDMPMVAAVYENRLRLGMKLQADPTVIYAVTQGQQSAGLKLTVADLQTESPYNTYLYKGLPPGAICAPGVAALQAVLHPAQTQAIYFISMQNGTHRSIFADTLAQQDANIRRYLVK